jgi:hypothetical protein
LEGKKEREKWAGKKSGKKEQKNSAGKKSGKKVAG